MESLFGPVAGRGEGMWKGEKVEKKNPGGGFFKIGTEGGKVFQESFLMKIFNGRIRREENELRAAGKGAGGRKTGSNVVMGCGSIDGEQEGCCTG